MSLKYQYFSSILLLISLCGCTLIPTAPTTTPIKTFDTFDTNLQEGKKYFDMEKYQEAVQYLSEAIRLEPKNQQAHALAGVAYTKLGKWSEACREFEMVVQLDMNSPDAEQAQKWLGRLSRPIDVLILPFVIAPKSLNEYGEDKMGDIASAFFNTLFDYLSNCGFYHVVIVKKRSDFARIIDSNLLSNLKPVCEYASQNGAKIMLSGFIDDFKFYQDIGPLLDPRMYLIPEYAKMQFHSASMKVTIKVYSTKDCCLINSVTDQSFFKNVPECQLVDAIKKTLNVLFNRIFIKINAKIM